jgi:hypothetical protein
LLYYIISGWSLVVPHRPQALPFFDEYYRELGVDGPDGRSRGRDVEADAAEADLAEEKVYE